MVHAGLVALVVLAGCRIGFDPIESAPDGGQEIPASHTASPDTTFTHRCDPGTDCEVDCRLAATCLVECNGAARCAVSCPATDCAVTECSSARDSTCDVGCGDAGMPPFQYGTNATCP